MFLPRLAKIALLCLLICPAGFAQTFGTYSPQLITFTTTPPQSCTIDQFGLDTAGNLYYCRAGKFVLGVTFVGSFLTASLGDFSCATALGPPVLLNACTPGTPVTTQSGSSYTFVGGVAGGIGDRGAPVKRTNTVTSNDTLPALGSGVSAGNTGFGSKWYGGYWCWGSANCLLNISSPAKISVNGAAVAASMTLTPQASAAIYPDADGVNWNAVVNNVFSHIQFSGTAPTCSFVSGGGTGPTCAFLAGSTDSLGTIILGTGTGSPTATPVFQMTYNTAFTTANGSSCVFTLQNAAGTWNARATVILTSGTNSLTQTAQYTVDNNAVNLATSSFYHVSYFCGGR